MDRDQRSRQQKSRGGSFARPVQKQAPPRQRPGPQPKPPRRPQPQLNPQKAGYVPGTPRRQRRVTQAEVLRRRNRRRALGVLGVLAVLVLGAFVSVNLLFKVTAFRIENFDRSTPADTGIYTEDEIIAALGIEQNSNLFGFSTAEKTQRLQAQFPYLEEVRVDVQLPGTVVVKVRPATERFACMYSGGWVVLSDARKILRSELSQPEGLTLLSCSLPADFTPEVGQTLTPQTYNSLLEGDTAATPEAARPTAEETLTQLCALLESEGLTDGVTAIDVMDQSKLSFTYQGRIVATLGNANRLDYKVRLARPTAEETLTQLCALLDPEKGLLASDRGTLDVSYQQTDGEIRGYFAPEEPEPTPEPTPEPEEGEDGEGEGESGEETPAPQE